MTVDTQLSFFPLDAPSSVADEADRTIRRLRRIAPSLMPHECLFVLAELSLLNICLDTVAHQVAQRREWDTRKAPKRAPHYTKYRSTKQKLA